MNAAIMGLQRRIEQDCAVIDELKERHEKALASMVQLATAMVALMMDPVVGDRVRELTSDVPNPVALLQKERNTARAQAMESLLELGWPYHEGLTYSNREGADLADQFWRTEFTNRAEMYRNAAQEAKSV